MNYLINNPHGVRDSIALVGGLGLYGATQGYRYLRNQYYRRRNSVNFQAAKGAYLSLKKNSKMAPVKRRHSYNTRSNARRQRIGKLVPKTSATYRTYMKRNLALKYNKRSRNAKFLTNRQKATKKAPKPFMAKNTGGAYAGTIGRTYKVKKTLELKILQTGALKNIEFKGVSTTADQTIFIGHANYTAETLVQLFWMSVMKAFMIKVGYPIIDFSESVPADIVGDTIVFRHKDSYQDGAAVQTSVVIAATSWHTFCTVNVRNAFIGKNNQFQLISLELDPLETSPFKYTRMWCKNARLMLHSESEMTVQNRTAPAVGVNEQDVIDNQPVKGVVYFGKGNGTQMKDVQGALVSEYVPGSVTGVIDVIPSGSGSNGQQEPPEPHFFSACKRTGAFFLDPGQTKSSSIRDTRNITISTFFNMVFGLERADNKKSLIKLGNHKLFCIEKIVDCVEAQPNINIGFEHNLRIGIVFKPGYNTYSNPYYESSYK